MKPTQIWKRMYKATNTYRPSPFCLRQNLSEELKKQKQATNFKDSKDKIEWDIKKLESYTPIGNPPISFIDFQTNIVINISDNFTNKGMLMDTYQKTVEIYAPSVEHISKDITKLLTEHNFTTFKKP